ncbi:MAG: hypothetical protein J6S56_04015 [Bacteroidales bacterium]|nr:hypothetical protein [Bacteroidales bacterium]
MRRVLICITICFLWLSARGQADSLLHLEEVTEEVADLDILSEDQDFNGEELLEEMEESDGVLNLNELSYSAAMQRLGFTDYQYYQLQLYIEISGPLVSIYELAAIDGFSEKDVERLRMLVKVEAVPAKRSFWRHFFKKSRSTLIVRDSWVLERQAGFDTARATHYDGSRDHLCFRYVFNSQDKFILKISGEKDAGEQFFRGRQRQGFDFYAGSLALKRFGVLRQAVVGDYRLNFGQGLVLGSSLLSGRGGDVSQLRRFSSGIRAVAPTNEGDFLRGAAATIGNTAIQGSLFAGQRFGSTTGATGFDLSFSHRSFRLGGRAACLFSWDTTSARPPDSPALAFQSLVASLDYQTTIRKVLLFGETAVSHRGKIALLQGVTLPFSPVTSIAIILRHYDSGFETPLGKAFGASSKNNGESGIYISLQHIVSRNVELKTYFDYYHLHNPTYRLDAPAQALDACATLRCTFTRYNLITLTYLFRDKPANSSEEPHYHRLLEQQQHRVRILWQYNPLKNVTCKSGIIWKTTSYKQTRERFQGLLLYQDLAVNCWQDRISIHARIAYFNTDRYDERLYAYEDDVYYAFTIGSYYYQGIRGYLVLRFKYRFFALWLRIGQTYYLDRQVVSSGLTQINKPHKTEVRLQTSWSW